MTMPANGFKDRAAGWLGRWVKRYLLYTAFTWLVATAVWVPYYILVVGFTLSQLYIYLWSSLPFCLLAYLVLAPYGKFVWMAIWNLEHHKHPWWRKTH